MTYLPSSPTTTGNYFQSRMAAIGATPENLQIRVTNPEAEPPASKIMEVNIFSEDRDGNIEILYYTLEGQIITYYTDAKNPLPRFHKVKRLKAPKGDQKYQMPAGQGTFPFFPPHLLEKYSEGEKIETLVLTEGVFKAFKAQVCGLDCVGLSSISHYASEGKLYSDISKMIERCGVERIIILWDADCRDISEKALSAGEDLTKRPSGFYAAAKRMWSLAIEAHPELEVTFSHIINDRLPGKGLDDLLLEAERVGIPAADVIVDLLENRGVYFYTQNITKDVKPIFGYFCLGDPQKFYDLHGQVIEDKVFNFHQEMYQADENGQVKMLKSAGL